jgi:hypothetical protein
MAERLLVSQEGVASPTRYETLETLWKWSWVESRVAPRPVIWIREGNEHRTGTLLHLVTGREVKPLSSKSQQTRVYVSGLETRHCLSSVTMG